MSLSAAIGRTQKSTAFMHGNSPSALAYMPTLIDLRIRLPFLCSATNFLRRWLVVLSSFPATDVAEVFSGSSAKALPYDKDDHHCMNHRQLIRWSEGFFSARVNI